MPPFAIYAEAQQGKAPIRFLELSKLTVLSPTKVRVLATRTTSDSDTLRSGHEPLWFLEVPLKKEALWQMVQTGLTVAVVIVNLPHGEAVDAAHAHRAAIFRLVVSLIALIGIPLAWWLGKKAKAETSGIASQILTDTVAEVSYQSDRRTLWRCNLYSFRRPRTLLMAILLPLIPSVLFTVAIAQSSILAAAVLFLPIFSGLALAWTALLVLALWLQILSRFPKGATLRGATTSLTRAGLIDKTPEKLLILPWSDITAIRENRGDIYFWPRGTISCYVPRGAFPDDPSRSAFAATAKSLWHGSKGA